MEERVARKSTRRRTDGWTQAPGSATGVFIELEEAGNYAGSSGPVHTRGRNTPCSMVHITAPHAADGAQRGESLGVRRSSIDRSVKG